MVSPYVRTSNLCYLIKSGETEQALAQISKMKNVNRFSAPLWTRTFLSWMQVDVDTPLLVACKQGNVTVVRALLEKGADPNRYVEGSWSAIEASFVRRSPQRLDIAKELVAYGADIDLYAGRQSALFVELSNAMYARDLDTWNYDLTAQGVIWLLENGASPADKMGNAVFHYLAFTGLTVLMKEVCVNYADYVNKPNEKGQTALFWAVSGNSVEGVAFLLERGADPTLKDDQGKTALDYAKMNSNAEIIALLEKSN